MNVLMIPEVAMAGIAFYVGLFHLLSYARRRDHHEDLTFALTGFSVGLYAAFSAGLYSVSSTAAGIHWQRGQLFVLALVTGALLWFVSDYTGYVSKRALYLFLSIAVVNALNQILFRGDLTWIAEKTSIKHIHSLSITFYEVAPGPLTVVQSVTGLSTGIYMLWATIRFYRHGNRKKARLLLLALGLLFAATLNDTAVSYEWYEFIYTIEYAYIGMVLLMAYSLTDSLLEVATIKEALQSSEEKYRTLFETSPEPIMLLGLDGTILDFNPAAAQLAGQPREALLNQPVLELSSVKEGDRSRLGKFLSQAAAGNIMDILELEILRGGQESRQIEVFPVLLKRGDEPYAIQTIARDMTERKQAEQMLRLTLERQLALGEFKFRIIATLSHEFRTPLAVILSSSGLLQDHGDKMAEHDRAKHSDRISSSIQYIISLLDDALTINQIQSSELRFQPAPLDIAAFCQEIITEVQTTRKTSARFVFASTGDCTETIVDKRLLRHIMSNLFSNAVKFSPPDSAISISLACDPEQVVLKVQDHGIGIPKADQTQLFDLFYRAENIGTARGTGLGLAIVKQSVDLHGGTITFESHEGVGTTFTVSIPRTIGGETDHDENPGN